MRAIISLVLIVLAGGIFFFFTKPAYDQVQTQQAQIAEYNAALDKATELQTLKQTLLSRYNSFNPSDIDRVQKLLPDSVDNIGLILDLDSLAGRYGLALQNVDVSSNQGGGGSAIGGIPAASQKYASLTLTFSTRGSYTNFEQFMTALQSSLRIVDLVSLTITGSSGGQSVANPSAGGQYTYNITLRTYWLK